MFDFTLEVYKLLLKRLIEKGYLIVPFGEYILKKDSYNKVAIIRHDVDRLSELSLNIAEIENKLNIKTSYYYRIVKGSNNPDIIKKVSQLGHEIGYHYEDLTIAKGDYSKAIKMFEKNLAYFRQFYPVKTICMHGSPLSKLDNRKIWDKINYRDYGIIGEPYYETNFNKFLYLTDTGRRWNGDKFSIRDKVHNTYDFNFKSTYDILKSLENNELPDNIMFTIHTNRWTNNVYFWVREFLFQNFKNLIKKIIVKNVNKKSKITN